MADKNLNINIVAKDKSQQALNKVQGSLNRTKSAVFNLRNALVGIGAGLAIKSIVDVGKQIESLQVRLKFLFGSVEEGAKAFDAMAKFAAKVPFSLGEIQQGAGVLAVVSKDADELATIMELTGNVAAVTGLDFKTTAEQIQRSLSAGISSADLFREKGVKSMLGFSAGATVSIEETRKALFKTFGANGEFAGATDELAKTLEGTLSMIGDKYFNFQKEIAEEFFVGLKKEFGNLNTALAVNEKAILQLAQSVGTALSDAVTFGASALKFFKENTETVTLAFIALLAIFAPISAGIALVIVVVDQFRKKLESIVEVPLKLADVFKGVFQFIEQEFNEFIGFFTKGFEIFINKIVDIRNAIPFLEDLPLPFDHTAESTDKASKSLSEFVLQQKLAREEIQRLTAFYAAFSEQMQSQGNGQLLDVDGTTKALSILTDKFSEFKEGFKSAMDKNIADDFAKAGKTAFNSLKKTLTDFVITGKLDMKSFGEAIKRALVEALIGEAIQFALKKSLALFKADAIKKALMSVYQGALKTFASIPFPFNIAAAAGAVAVGMGMVNKIKGFEKGGRPPVGRASLVGEAGAELFIPDSAGTIIPNNQLGGGNQTINVNIHANDTQGFDELLIKRRATIVNVINDALNSQGKEALV